MIPFNFHHLYYFYTIAKLGSVSRAAKELRISQPALSGQIKQLQHYLNLKLFEKQGRNLVLTEEGHHALAYAKQIFDAGKEFADAVRDRSQKGRIRIQIGALNSIPKIFVNALLAFIMKHEPGAHIHLEEDTLERMTGRLKDHFLDLVLADTPFQPSLEEKIENRLAAKIPVLFCAHPSLAKKYNKLPRDLHHAPMIFPTADSRMFHSVQEYLVAQNIEPNIIAEIQDVELAKLMAMEGLGIVPLNQMTALHAPRSKLVILPQDTNSGLYESIYIISKKRTHDHPLAEKITKEFRFSIPPFKSTFGR